MDIGGRPRRDLNSAARKGVRVRISAPAPRLASPEEEFGFNAEPYVRTGKFVKVLGL